jgi:hypothetical protein
VQCVLPYRKACGRAAPRAPAQRLSTVARPLQVSSSMPTDPLRRCTWLIVALAACACAAGLGSARVYGELALAPAMRGQDLLTLLVLPALLAAELQRAPGPASQALRLGLLG